jgi:DNA-directed RNA polymerase specialized sigma24 family protein
MRCRATKPGLPGYPGTYRRAGPPGAQLEDTDGMNRERAETFLRLVAEAELRQLTTDPRDSAPLPDVPGAEREAAGLLRRPAVVAMLRALDDRQREAITLQYHAGLSEAETAATMRISRSGTWTTPPAPQPATNTLTLAE